MMSIRLSAHALACLTLTATLQAQSEEISDLGTSSVTAEVNAIVPGADVSEQILLSLPGGSSLIRSEDWAGQVVTPEEIFQFDPGVYARSSGTGNDSRLSVRGSGIQRRYGSRGVSLLLDGSPLNAADGSFYFRSIDPMSISHIESFRGGNGLRYGANQLGGAIQIYQKNGINYPGGELILEAGSYETYRGHLRYGGQQGKWDYLAGYSYSESDGYRDRQNWQTHHFNAEVGYSWNESARTSMHLLFNDSDALLAGALTEAQFQDDPRQSDPNRHPDTDRDLSTIRVGQNTRWRSDEGHWSFYTNYQYLDFDHLTGLGNFTYNNLVDYDMDEFAIGLTGYQDYRAAGLEQRLYTSVSAEYGRNKVGGFSGFVRPGGPAPGINDREDTSTNLKVYVENDTRFKEKHHAIAGLGYLWTERRRTLGPNDERSVAFDTTQEGVLAKLGYLYEHSADVQYFANVSRTVEVAPFSEAANSTTADPQIALTYEVGSRFSNRWLEGEMTFYVAEVQDEFVYEETAPNSNVYAVTNADTRHCGIEFAARVDVNEAMGWELPVQMDFDLSYQLNDHTFDDGPAEGNQIPVVSEHVIASRFTCSGDRWATSLSVDWLPEGLYADNNNTLKTPGYAVLDWSAEVQLREGLTLYGGVTNLFDKKYVSTVKVNPDSADYIYPGDGRSGYIGVKLAW